MPAPNTPSTILSFNMSGWGADCVTGPTRSWRKCVPEQLNHGHPTAGQWLLQLAVEGQ